MKAETSDETNKTISPQTYDLITSLTKEILNKFTNNKEIKNAPVLSLLLDIESRVEEADAFIADNVHNGDATTLEIWQKSIKKVREKLKQSKKEEEENLKKKMDLEISAKNSKTKDRVVVTDVRRTMPISMKRAVEKKKEKKIELTEEQINMKKYGGELLF